MSSFIRGTQRANHKYIRREYKNGKWVYYYEDGKSVKELPKGQNYKTKQQVEEEQQATEAAKVESDNKAKAAAKKKADVEARVNSKIDRTISRGKKAMENVNVLLSTRIIDLPKAVRYLRNKD